MNLRLEHRNLHAHATALDEGHVVVGCGIENHREASVFIFYLSKSSRPALDEKKSSARVEAGKGQLVTT